jgi:AcrR family transcriptional regulator
VVTEALGRPRDREIDQAIIVAVLDEVAANGYEAATMAGIARRAGVPKSTVYRRWDCKQELVIDALEQMRDRWYGEPTGATQVDIYNLMAGLVARWHHETVGAVTLSIITEIARNEPLFEVWNNRLVDPFRQRIVGILRHGVETNQVRDDVDVVLVAEMFLGLPLQMMMRPGRADLSDIPERFVRMVFDGLVPR